MSWEEVHRARAWGSWPSEDVVRVVKRARAALDVLDIGCGGGANLRLLLAEGHRPVGLDLAPSALLRLSAAPHAHGAALVRGDATRLPFGTAFDLVLDVESLCYLGWEDLQRAWGEMARVVRPGGTVLSVAFTAGCTAAGPSAVWSEVPEGALSGVGRTTFLGEAHVNELVASAGLRLVDLQTRSRTTGPARELVEEWVVLATREGP